MKLPTCILGVACLFFAHGCMIPKLEEPWTQDLSQAARIVYWTGTDKGMVATKIFTNDTVIIQDLASKLSETTPSVQILMGPFAQFLFLGPNGEPIAYVGIIEADSTISVCPLLRRGKFYLCDSKDSSHGAPLKYLRAEKFVRAVYAYMQTHEPEELIKKKAWYRNLLKAPGPTFDHDYEKFLFGEK